MVHYPNEIVTTEKLQEVLRSGRVDFPCITLDSQLEKYAGRCSTWHWHDYFEFGVVAGGEMELCTQRQTLRLRAGEGYFVNSEVMHQCRVAQDCDRAQLHVHQFDRSLVAGCNGIARRYVQPVESCAALDALVLRPEEPAHARLLAGLNAAFAEARDEPAGYDLSIAARILRCWHDLYHLAQPLLAREGAVGSAETSRIKLMLACIHNAYGESLSVERIARAAGVCARECYRCFRSVLGTTPTLYLMRHRVNAAARLLIDSDRSITDIALTCGFSGPSYFCKVFRDVMGISPRDFRRNRPHTDTRT